MAQAAYDVFDDMRRDGVTVELEMKKTSDEQLGAYPNRIMYCLTGKVELDGEKIDFKMGYGTNNRSLYVSTAEKSFKRISAGNVEDVLQFYKAYPAATTTALALDGEALDVVKSVLSEMIIGELASIRAYKALFSDLEIKSGDSRALDKKAVLGVVRTQPGA